MSSAGCLVPINSVWTYHASYLKAWLPPWVIYSSVFKFIACSLMCFPGLVELLWVMMAAWLWMITLLECMLIRAMLVLFPVFCISLARLLYGWAARSEQNNLVTSLAMYAHTDYSSSAFLSQLIVDLARTGTTHRGKRKTLCDRSKLKGLCTSF